MNIFNCNNCKFKIEKGTIINCGYAPALYFFKDSCDIIEKTNNSNYEYSWPGDVISFNKDIFIIKDNVLIDCKVKILKNLNKL